MNISTRNHYLVYKSIINSIILQNNYSKSIIKCIILLNNYSDHCYQYYIKLVLLFYCLYLYTLLNIVLYQYYF